MVDGYGKLDAEAAIAEQEVTEAGLIRHLANVIRITDSGTYRDKAGARPSIHPEFEDAINALKAAMEAEALTGGLLDASDQDQYAVR